MNHVFKAFKEALGSDYMKGNAESQLNKRVSEIGGRDEVESSLVALKEAYGTGVVSPNIERQIRERVKQLEEHPRSAPLGVEKADEKDEPTKPNLGPMNNSGENAGTDVGKPRADSIKGDTNEPVNATQKAAFEQNGADGGGNAPVTGGGRSKVAAATNTGNKAGGPGAAHVR